jgi:AraC-like DNA-binding protein
MTELPPFSPALLDIAAAATDERHHALYELQRERGARRDCLPLILLSLPFRRRFIISLIAFLPRRQTFAEDFRRHAFSAYFDYAFASHAFHAAAAPRELCPSRIAIAMIFFRLFALRQPMLSASSIFAAFAIISRHYHRYFAMTLSVTPRR